MTADSQGDETVRVPTDPGSQIRGHDVATCSHAGSTEAIVAKVGSDRVATGVILGPHDPSIGPAPGKSVQALGRISNRSKSRVSPGSLGQPTAVTEGHVAAVGRFSVRSRASSVDLLGCFLGVDSSKSGDSSLFARWGIVPRAYSLPSCPAKGSQPPCRTVWGVLEQHGCQTMYPATPSPWWPGEAGGWHRRVRRATPASLSRPSQGEDFDCGIARGGKDVLPATGGAGRGQDLRSSGLPRSPHNRDRRPRSTTPGSGCQIRVVLFRGIRPGSPRDDREISRGPGKIRALLGDWEVSEGSRGDESREGDDVGRGGGVVDDGRAGVRQGQREVDGDD